MTSLNQGLSLLAPGGGKMRDPGNEVGCATLLWLLVLVYSYTCDLYDDLSFLSDSLS